MDALRKEKIDQISITNRGRQKILKNVDGIYTYTDFSNKEWNGYFDEEYNFVIPITEYNEEMFREVFALSGNSIEVYDREGECIKRLTYLPEKQKVTITMEAEYDDIISKIVYPSGKEIRYFYDTNILTSASEEYFNGELINRKTYAYDILLGHVFEAVYEGESLSLTMLNEYSLETNPLRCGDALSQTIRNELYVKGMPSSLLWIGDELIVWKNEEE
mgnify:FL=1